MLWAVAAAAGLLPGRCPLKRHGPAILRVDIRLQERTEQVQERTVLPQAWASKYDLVSEVVTIEPASTTAGPLDAYETAEKPTEEGEVRAVEERTALILLSDASGWQGESVRALADRLAIFCGCTVLLPDLLRGEPPCAAPRDSEAYQA